MPRLVWATLLVVVVGGCGGTPREDGESTLVFAAASLANAFTELAADFEEAPHGFDVGFHFGASSTLREQILEGAPADVFASANLANMDQVADAGDVAGQYSIFARNRLAIAVPAGNPAGVGGLDDFDREELLIGLCAEQVPCGELARLVLEKGGVEPLIDTNEPDVGALLTKIEAGELDAGIVYQTDILVAGDSVEGIEIPIQLNLEAQYPIAVMTSAPNPSAANAFVEFALSADGQAILARHGFLPP